MQKIQLEIGQLKGRNSSTIYSVIFNQSDTTEEKAEAWLKDHDFEYTRIIQSDGNIEFRQRIKSDFVPETFSTIELESKEAKLLLKGQNYKKLFELNGIEIFSTGTWNGDKYTEKDLDAIVESFEQVGFRPPIKLGHKENSGDPAYGWIKSIRREGKKLIADFMDLPEKLFNAIKDKQFDTVSSEIYWNMERAGKKFSRVLKAVALLGAETPAVNLKPLRESFSLPDGGDIHSYKFTKQDIDDSEDEDMSKFEEQIAKLKKELAEAKEKITELSEQEDDADSEAIKKLQQDIQDRDKRIEAIEKQHAQEKLDSMLDKLRVPAYRPFIRSFINAVNEAGIKEYSIKLNDKEEKLSGSDIVDKLIIRINQDAEYLFKEVGKYAEDVNSDDDDLKAGDLVDKRTRDYMDEHGVDDYKKAMHKVLNDDPELKKRYHSEQEKGSEN